jgi:hypothetical protein
VTFEAAASVAIFFSSPSPPTFVTLGCTTSAAPARMISRKPNTVASFSPHAIDVDVAARTLTLDGRTVALVTAQDVTDRNRAESQLLERIATVALSADIAVVLNRTHDLHSSLQRCAEALVAHLDGR